MGEHHHNFFVYGENGLKGYFGGHDCISHDNVYAFTIGHCVNVGYGHELFVQGHEDQFFNNVCVMQNAGPYLKVGCSSTKPMTIAHNNSVYDPNGTPIAECGMSLEQWQAEGHDLGTTVASTPSDDVILSWGR